jgi:hypothetical protein
VVARDRENRRAEPLQEPGCPLVLLGSTAVGQVAARDDELRPHVDEQRCYRLLDRGILARAEMQVGDVENAGGHGRSRL